MQKPIKFQNRNGKTLFGMIFIPQRINFSKKIAIVMSVNAIKYRIGTFRLHTILAKDLCEAGYFVMYFDPEGIGDSEGDFEEKMLFEHYFDIQKGKYSNDIKDAIDFLVSTIELDDILCFGLCGGAISMLISAANDPRIHGLILMGIPVLSDYVEGKIEKFDESSIITSNIQARKSIFLRYKKITSYKTWIKLFTLKMNVKNEFQVLIKSIFVLATYPFKNFLRRIFRTKLKIGDAPVSNHSRFNMLFQTSFLKFVSENRKILFIFGDLDHMTLLFKSEFQDKVLTSGNPFEKMYDIHFVKDANHIFSTKDSQVRLKKIIKKWLKNEYPILL